MTSMLVNKGGNHSGDEQNDSNLLDKNLTMCNIVWSFESMEISVFIALVIFDEILSVPSTTLVQVAIKRKKKDWSSKAGKFDYHWIVVFRIGRRNPQTWIGSMMIIFLDFYGDLIVKWSIDSTYHLAAMIYISICWFSGLVMSMCCFDIISYIIIFM